MMATKITNILWLFCFGCASPSENPSETNVGGGENPIECGITVIARKFNKNYVSLESNSKVKDRNFYWATLVEQNPDVIKALQNNPVLTAYLETAKQRLATIAVQTNTTATEYAKALQFSVNERIAISTAVRKAVEVDFCPFINLTNRHLGPSGAFNKYQEVASIARLNQLIAEEMMLGINQIVDTYVAGIDPRYPDIDKISYVPNSVQYTLLLKNLVTQLNSNKAQNTLFYQPFLEFALGALKLNNRDEAGKFMPLKEGENAKAYLNIQTINWNNFQYSIIIVLGDAPNSAGDLPNISIGGMERCDYAVTLFNQGKAPLIAFTGGNVAPFQSQYHEAIEMKKYVMMKYGIPENKILVDPHARHTTTNIRNIGRLIYYYGIPEAKKVLVTTTKSQSEYVASSQFSNRCRTELGHIPFTLFNRTSERDLEFTPKIEVLHLNSTDPLDP